MDTEITTSSNNQLSALQQAGLAANRAAAKHVFSEYQERRTERTRKIQQVNLRHFADFLTSVGAVPGGDLFSTPTAWHGITYGLVEAFKRWMIETGYSVASINLALSSVKVYARLAAQAGVIAADELALIKAVSGYSRKEAKELNKRRTEVGYNTRKPDAKKEKSITLDKEAVRSLKRDHDLNTPQGRRDALLFALLIDLGLRCSEAADLKVGDVNRKEKELTFYRRKVDKVQSLELRGDVWNAVSAWFEYGDAPVMADASLLRGSRKGGHLTRAGMSERAITGRVRYMGKALLGIDGLSAHDLRHSWATIHSRGGVDPFRLQEAGGWNSLAMPRHYVEAAKIANEGMGSI